jgi:hypothetical protein
VSVAYQIAAGGRIYTVVDDISTQYRALIVGAVVDEILGGPLPSVFDLQIDRKDLQVITKVDGIYAIAGYPEIAFPKLNSQSYTVDLQFSAPGYRGFAVQVTIPQNAAFPVTAPLVQMRRLPVRVQGRVVKASDRSPIGAARVLSVDDPNQPPPPTHVGILRTPLYFAHALGISAQEIQFTTGSSYQLSVPATGGSAILELNNRIGLNAGNPILRIGGDPVSDPRVEFCVIDSLVPPNSNLSLPGAVVLRNTLNHSVPSGATVWAVTGNLVGPTWTIGQQADDGDSVLVLKSLIAVNTVAVLDPNPAAVEYHAVGGLSDTDGYYSIDGIGRERTVFLKASAGSQNQTRPLGINYLEPANVLDFLL